MSNIFFRFFLITGILKNIKKINTTANIKPIQAALTSESIIVIRCIKVNEYKKNLKTFFLVNKGRNNKNIKDNDI